MAPEPAGAAGAPTRCRHVLATSLFSALGAGAALGALMLGAMTPTWPWIAVSGLRATAAFLAFTLNLVVTLRGLAAAPAAAR